MKTDLSDVGRRARWRIALRLLPFVFVIYMVNVIDRVNISFATLRMSVHLGFSDWHADRSGERRLHTAVPLLAAGAMYALLILMRHNVPAAIPVLLLVGGF
jgi:hypothetical protein